MLSGLFYFLASGFVIGIVILAIFGACIDAVNSKQNHPEQVDFLIEMILDGDLKSISPINNQKFRFETDDKTCQVVILRDQCAFNNDLSRTNNTWVTLHSDQFFLKLSSKEINRFEEAYKKIGHNRLDEKFMEYKLEKARKLISSLDSNRPQKTESRG